jgi:hypothetical protein
MAYENLFQPKGFFRDYEPVVLNTHLPKIAETLRGRYDEGVAAKSLLDRAIGSVRTIGNDAQAINRAKMDMDGIINSRVDFENMGKVITDATSRFLTDHSVLNAIDSYKNWEEGEALKAKMIAERGASNVYDFNMQVKKDAKGKAVIDPVTGAPMMETAAETWDSDTKGIYRPKVALRQDLEGRINNLISDVAKDGGATIRRAAMAAGWTPEEQALLNYEMPLYAYTSVGVSKKKIQDLTDALASNLYNSPEGQQFIAANDQLFVNPTTGTTYTEDESKGMLKDMLFNVGSKQIGLVSNIFKITDASGVRAGTKQDADSPYLPTLVPDQLTQNPFKELGSAKSIENALKSVPTGSAKSNALVNFELGKESVTTQKLLEAYNAGNITSAARDLQPNDRTFVEFLRANKSLQADVPRKDGESEMNYLIRLGGIFQHATQPYAVLLEDQTSAKALLYHSFNSVGEGVLFQENGEPAANLKEALYSQTKRSAGADAGDTGFFGWGSGVVDALKDSVDPTSKDAPGSTELITSGVNAGRWRHKIMYDGSVYSVITEVYKDQALHFEGLASIYNLRASLKKTDKPIKIDIGDHTVIAGNVIETEGSDTRVRTKVALNINGVPREMYLEDAENYLTQLYIGNVRRYNGKVASVYKDISETRQKAPF